MPDDVCIIKRQSLDFFKAHDSAIYLDAMCFEGGCGRRSYTRVYSVKRVYAKPKRDALLNRGVNVRTYWEHLPPAVDPERFPEAAWLRDRILVLPVHQGLTNEGVEWLARLLLTLGKLT